jgi:nitrate/nitrite transporter NarK
LYLSGTAAAGGIAIISTMGTVSGAVGPALLGWIKTATGGFDDGMYALSGLLILASLLMLSLVSDKRTAPASTPAD